MRRFTVAILVGTVLCFVILMQPAMAQTYLFSLDREVVDVYWESDGTVWVNYELTFTNDPAADPMQYVDVGVPTGNYELSRVEAWLDGVPVAGIETSPYVTPGVAIDLGSRAIPPGQKGVVRLSIPAVRDKLYYGDEQGYASALFGTNWFDPEFVYGTTELTVRFHLPPGVQPDEPRWHASPSGWPEDAPTPSLDTEGRVLYTWYNPSANGYTGYVFGASFPVDYVPAQELQRESLLSRLGLTEDTIIGFGCCGGIALLVALIVFGGVYGSRRRKLAYLPPKIAIEGHGIKRGLTAVEAAILLETTLDKVLTMILFSLVKKGAARVTSEDPLKVEPITPLPEDLRAYEKTFLEAVAIENRREREKQLQKMFITLVKSVQKKMKGFSLRETKAYYQSIVKKAWKQVEEAETPEVRSERYAEDLEWTMLDRRFEDRTRRVFRTGPVFLPGWWGAYRPSVASGGAGGGKVSVPSGRMASGPAGRVGLPTLPGANFAASIVRGVQNTAGNLVSSLTSFTGGVTKTTNPPPPPSTRSGGSFRSSGGGSSCACACACACAGCACACAGGGR